MADRTLTRDELLDGIVHVEMAIRMHINECRKCRKNKRCVVFDNLNEEIEVSLDNALAEHVGPGICLGCFKPLDDHERGHG